MLYEVITGDIITAINDTNMNSPDEIKSYLTQNGVKPIELHITRDGEPMSFNGVVPVENTSRDFYTLGIMYKEDRITSYNVCYTKLLRLTKVLNIVRFS